MSPDPELLSHAAARLAAGADEVRAAVAGLDAPVDGWSGAAATRSRARSELAVSAGQALAAALDEVASDVAATARRVGSAVEVRDSSRRSQERLLDELRTIRAGEPGPLALARESDLARALARAQEVVTTAEEDLARAGRELARMLDAVDPLSLLPPWAAALVLARPAVSAVRAGVAAARKAVSYGRWLAAARSPALRGAATEVAARTAFLRGSFPTVPWLERLAPGASRTILPLAVIGGVRDAVGGDGHGGARGVTTRVLGGAAAVAGIALLVGVGPEVALVAGGVLVAHMAWSAGTAVYDRRGEIGGFLSRAGSAVRDRAESIGRGLRDGLLGLAASPWRALAAPGA